VNGAAATDLGSSRPLADPPQFELCVLETMLEHVTMHLERAFQQVESVAGPGLPALRVKVSSPATLSGSKRPRRWGRKGGSWRITRAVQVSQTRLEWLRRLRMDIAQLSTTVISVRTLAHVDLLRTAVVCIDHLF
jgi:hypothetical protein